MKVGKKFSAEMLDNGANGNGIAKIDGFVCFVPYCVKGENVTFKIKNIQKNFCECELEGIISPSKDRVIPQCPYFEACGGCQLQHMSKTLQGEYKTNQIKSIFKKSFDKKIDVSPCVSENEYHYRNKVNFAIHDNKLCFYNCNQQLFVVESCPLFVVDLTDIISIFNKYLASVNTNFEALHIRLLGDEYQFTFVSTTLDFPQKEQLIALLQQKNIKFSLNLCKNSIKNSSNITNSVICVYGDVKQDYDILGIKNKISPASFLQINQKVQDRIYNDINLLIPKTSKVINAYGGTGILSSIISKQAKIVYSIELNKAASKNCEEMIKLNNLKNIKSVCGDCKVEIPSILQKDKITHIIFDPPRSGIDKTILNCVKNLKIPNIIYLSCNPATLVRDLKLLDDIYEIFSVQPYDMFPQTAHIETLVQLKLKV
ncbi:MAG: 23S rRNA (uracil(1939)-C(5))-methyltransferase RlmD [Firmicutes bacterium]|nr:23S rRNA (uracil(1939)-C(5))-methyltransferase RlmD [Bacillota bacterium]